MTRPPMLDALIHDLRYALRTLRKSPGFTLVAVLTLALGIGANTALFTIADRVLLRPPVGVQEPDRVARVYAVDVDPISGEYFTGVWDGEYAALHDDKRAFAHVASYLTPSPVTLTTSDGGAPRSVDYEMVTPSFFPLLGVRPALGRFFTEDENRAPSGVRVVVLSYALWQSRFGGDPGVLGQTVQLDSTRISAFNQGPYTVVGVAPKHFTGVDLSTADIWVPMTAAAGTGEVLVQLHPGVALGQASAAATLDVRRADRSREIRSELRIELGSLIAARGPGQSTGAVAIIERLVGVVAIILLIACANIANLLLARAAHRRREIAVRLALGISRRRLVGQLLTESLLLALLGGAAALLIAVWGGLLLRALLLPGITWAGPPVDLRVVGFTAAVTIVTGLLVGLIPALQASRPDLTTSLKEGWRAQLGRPSTLRAVLLVMQVAFSVMLLVGAGLFIRSLQHVRAIDLGVDTDHLIVARAAEGRDASGLPADYGPRLGEVADRVRTMPGVAGVAMAQIAPLRGRGVTRLVVPGRDSLPQLKLSSDYVTRDYFATVGTRVVRGRAFTTADRVGAPLVAIVNETMAHALWPGESALGKCIKVGHFQSNEPPCTYIVGVSHDTHQLELIEHHWMQVYLPMEQHPAYFTRAHPLIIRTTGDPVLLVAPLRRMLTREFPHGVNVLVEPLQQTVDPQLRPWRLGVAMFGAFGLLALVVASVGLYSVVSYAVAQRTHEMGVRLALGARAGDVARLVLGQSVRVTIIGLLLGTGVALAAGKLIASMLYDTPTYDPVVLGAVALVLVAVAVVASLLPARRATRVDPMVALRAE